MWQIPRPGEKGKNFKSRIAVPAFRRTLPFYFDVGERPLVSDDEKEQGLVDKYGIRRTRPVELKSAPLKPVDVSRKT